MERYNKKHLIVVRTPVRTYQDHHQKCSYSSKCMYYKDGNPGNVITIKGVPGIPHSCFAKQIDKTSNQPRVCIKYYKSLFSSGKICIRV